MATHDREESTGRAQGSMPSAESLAKLSPHREHESNWLKSLLCRIGLHRWYRVDLDRCVPLELSLCRWCPKVKMKGALHQGE